MVAVAVLGAVAAAVAFSGRTDQAQTSGADGPGAGVLPTASAKPATSTTAAPTSTEAASDPTATLATVPQASRPSPPVTIARGPSDADLLGEDVSSGDLRVPARPPNQGQYKALSSFAGKSGGFNPCRTTHYVVHAAGGPPNGLSLVQEAVRKLEAATGLRFSYDGTTEAIPASSPRSGRISDLKNVYEPVVIGWATHDQTDLFNNDNADTVGVAVPEVIIFDSGDRLFVSGAVVLLAGADLTPGFGAGATVGNVLLHELGHLVGLDHVDDTKELMQPTLSEDARDGYGPGDRRGLWNMGASRGCASTWIRLR